MERSERGQRKGEIGDGGQLSGMYRSELGCVLMVRLGLFVMMRLTGTYKMVNVDLLGELECDLLLETLSGPEIAGCPSFYLRT